MNCEQVTERLPDYLNGSLEARHIAAVEMHLAGCARCKTEVESLQALWTDLVLLPAEKPSEASRARFYSMLEAYQQGLHQAQPHWGDTLNRWLNRWWPKQPALQFAFAAVFLILGLVAGYQLGGPERGAGEVTQLREEVRSMREMVTLALLRQPSPSERLRGVSWANRVEQPDTEVLSALLQIVNDDPNVNVRLAAVDALYLYADQPAIRKGLLQSLSRQTSPLVQIALIDLVVEIRERQAIEALRQLIQNEKINQAVRERAQWGVQQLL